MASGGLTGLVGVVVSKNFEMFNCGQDREISHPASINHAPCRPVEVTSGNGGLDPFGNCEPGPFGSVDLDGRAVLATQDGFGDFLSRLREERAMHPSEFIGANVGH